MSLLEHIDGPQDLESLSEEELSELAQEVREHIIDTVGEIAGTSAPTSAPASWRWRFTRCSKAEGQDPLGRGPPGLPHKILTGRREELGTIRRYGGLAPFCSIAESPHDIMGAGHASTSIATPSASRRHAPHGVEDEGRSSPWSATER